MGLLTRAADSDVIDFATTRPAEAAPFNRPRTIVAAAQRINFKSASDTSDLINRPFVAWQNDAWAFHDSIGEINYGHEILASIMSRMRLYAAVAVDPDAAPTSTTQLRRRLAEKTDNEEEFDQTTGLDVSEFITPEVMDYMDECLAELGTGHGGMSGLLRMFTLNMSVPGECYLAKIDNRYSIRSTSEVTIRLADQAPVLREARNGHTANGTLERILPKSTFVARIWRTHPRFSKEPASSMMALLEVCDELLTLQRMIRGIARSRMNAGMLFIPDGLAVAATSVDEDKEGTEDENYEIIDELFKAMTTPIVDESSGSSVVPMVITGPDHLGKEIQHITFERESDQWLIERADRVLERIINGLNIPKEMMSGLDNVKYVNANVVSENLYGIHIEPLAVTLCDALTSVHLREKVRRKFPDIPPAILAKICIWYDPTEVVIKADPAEAATEGYNLYTLSGDAWRRSHGFSDTDAPSQAEIAFRMVMEKMSQNLPPEVQAHVLKVALPELFGGESGDSPLRAMRAPVEQTYGSDDAITQPSGGNGSAPRSETETTPVAP